MFSGEIKRSAGKLSENVSDYLTQFCTDMLQLDLFRSLGSYQHTISEESMFKEMIMLVVPNHSVLADIVAPRSLAQMKEEEVSPFVSRMQGNTSLCELSNQCTSGFGD